MNPSSSLQVANHLMLRIIIDVEPSKVWRALTESEFTQYYLNGCSVHSNWNIDDPIEFKMEIEGKEQTLVEGFVMEYKEGKLLKHSLFPSSATYANTRINHLTVSYELIDLVNQTELILRQEGFQQVEEGEQRYRDSVNGWEQSLPKLKEIAESI